MSIPRVHRYQYGPGLTPAILEAMYVQEFGGLVGYVCNRFRMDAMLAEDVVQEAFVDLWQHWSRYADARTPFAVLRKFVQMAAFTYCARFHLASGDLSFDRLESDQRLACEVRLLAQMEPEPALERVLSVARSPQDQVQQVTALIQSSSSWQALKQELQQRGYRVGQVRWYRHAERQAQARREGWVCQRCGRSAVAFATRTLCEPCRVARQIERQQAAGFVCQECGRSDVRKAVAMLCQVCYAALKRAGQVGVVQKRRVAFVCVACGRSDRRHNAHGLCVSCYQVARQQQGKRSVGKRLVLCGGCGQEQIHHAKGLCQRCYGRRASQWGDKQVVVEAG